MKNLENNSLNKHHNVRNFLNSLKLVGVMGLLSIFSDNEALAQGNISRDATLYNIEQILKQDPNSSYDNLIKQRDILLQGYGIDVNKDFLEFQKQKFLEAVQTNQQGMGNKMYEIKSILWNQYGINFSNDDPINILSKALIEISKRNDMSYMKKYTNYLSGKYDINFVNAYGFIQCKNQSTYQKVGGIYMPNWELNGGIGAKTLDIVISLLKKNQNVTTGNNGNTATTPRSNTSVSTNNTPSRVGESHIEIPTSTNNGNRTTTPNRATPSVTTTPTPVATPTPKTNPSQTSRDIEITTEPSNNTRINPVQAPEPKKVEPVTPTKPKVSTGAEINLDESMFDNEVMDIVENMSWNETILAQKLSPSKLNGISYMDIINTVNGFKHNGLKKAVMYHLLNNDVVTAQKVLGLDLDCHSMYPGYKAGKILGRQELAKMKDAGSYRRYCDVDEVLGNPNIPNDVKEVYKKFLDGKIDNKGMEYSIVSKTDYRIYLFSADHYLLSRQNTILGADIGDAKNDPQRGIQTTPGGIYEVGNGFLKYGNRDFVVNYGSHYIVLIPKENQYNYSSNYTMGVHGDYKGDPTRKLKLNSNNVIDHRSSNGCINIDSDNFGEIYNHLKPGTILYVTFQPGS